VRICKLLEGMPLALELASAWTPLMSAEQIAQEIERDLDFLSSTYPDMPARQRSLRATFEHSFQLLSPEEQRVLCRLSIFPASFERQAAEQVAGASLAILSALCDRSLVEQVRTGNGRSPTRYRMHELIRQFSREKLGRDESELGMAKARHRAYYMSFLNARNDKVMGGSQPYQAVQDVSGEIENVRQALDQAIVECNLNELGYSFDILMFFYEIRGLFAEAEEVFARIRRCFEDFAHEGRAYHEQTGRFLGRARMYHGWYCMHLARFDEAIELTQQGIDACLQSGDRKGYGMGLNSLGLLALSQGRYQQALRYLEESHDIALETGDIWWQASTCGNLAILATMQGDLTRAAELSQHSLDLMTRLGDEWGMAGSLDILGDLAVQQGDLELAEKCFRQGLQLREKLNQRWRYALTLSRLGGIAYRRQEYLEAKSDYQESLSLLRDFGERLHLSSTLARFGEVFTALGEYDSAREALQDSLHFARQISAEGITLRALLGMAELLLKVGESEQAYKILAAICEHPSLDHEDQERARSLLAEVRRLLSPQDIKPSPESEGSADLNKLVGDAR
jgi:tetratricopeptide (TPR) repeat protein